MDRRLDFLDFPTIEIDKKIRLIELFGGIGSQAMALRDIGADFEHYRLVEFDKYAIKSYNAIHGTNFETMDIKNVHGADLGIVEKDRYTYLLTYSFPCTDLSVAGKMLGMSRKEWKEGKSTRSGLLWEVERILEECSELPQILLMENVSQVHGKKNLAEFNSWIEFLKSKGYQNFWQDLNARDYGIPQNRVRCFMVSILSDGYVGYEFPKPVELKTVMKDYLEDSVDEKYYINSEKAQKLIAELIERGELPQTDNRQQTTEIIRPLICVSSPPEKSALPTALPQDATGESATCGQKEAVLLRNMTDRNKEPSADVTDVACTLMARDYKGLSNFGTNGVIEKWQK